MAVRRIRGVWTEEEVCQFLKVDLEKLNHLRQKRELPFLKLDKVTRFYEEEDIKEWLLNKRKILYNLDD